MSSSFASNAYYDADIATFIGTTSDVILGRITANNAFAVDPEQRDAWLMEIEVLKRALAGVEGTIFLEFNVPRIGSRIDAVLISGPTIFAIEFKVGETNFKRDDINQVWDYALDLKNFHKASHNAPIIPILVATHALQSETALPAPHDDQVFPPVRCNSEGLRYLIHVGLEYTVGDRLDARKWGTSPYQPTPTIIEAAQTLYAQHSVDAIARHDAGARNLKVRSGPGKLNNVISGNSWYKAGSMTVWEKGVSDGKEESIGAAYPSHPQSDVQSPRGLGRLAGRQDFGRSVRAIRGASKPDHRLEAAIV